MLPWKITSSIAISLLVCGCATDPDRQTGAVGNGELAPPDGGLGGPIVVAGNPDCDAIGLDGLELKIDPPPPPGETQIELEGGLITFEVADDNAVFSFASTLGIDAIIAKGGRYGSHVYTYDPPATEDHGLHPTVNPSGKPAELSHITICYSEPEEPIDLCENVTCDAAEECVTASCDPETGECVYAPLEEGSPCSDDNNPCTMDQCNQSGECVHVPGNSGTLCREAAGDCDVAEYCDGMSAECPTDVLSSQTLCRPAVGDCDVAEYCDGESVDCPSDSVLPDGTVCHQNEHECGVYEVCDGNEPVCPVPMDAL